MESQQDLAVNTLTVLDQSIDTSMLCMGDATFKKNIKVYNNIHLQKDIRIVGNILPISDTSTIGLLDKQWLELYASNGKFNKVDVDILNVNKINYLDKKDDLEKEYEYINIDNESVQIHLGRIRINVKNIKHRIVIYDLSELVINTNLMNIVNSTINIKLNKHDNINKIKIIIINQKNYNIKFDNTQILNIINVNDNVYQIYEFLYVDELDKFIITYNN
jgi:hypothetical protein